MDIDKISYEVRGAIYDVYKELGPGLLESIYESAMRMELKRRYLRFETQKKIEVCYKGVILPTDLRQDLLVEDQLIVELKSVEALSRVHYKQLLTYLKITDKKLGLLVNFNTDNILTSIRRVVNS